MPRRMPIAVTCLASAMLAACASSGVIPVGDGVMLLTKKGAGGAFTNGNEVLADLYKEANAHCRDEHKQLQTVSTTAENAIPFVHMPYAELKFRCVTSQ